MHLSHGESRGPLETSLKETMFDPKYLVFLVPALSVGCTTATWNGKNERWGSLKEVLRNGQTQGRVAVAQLTQAPGAVGLGVLKELKGEVTIVGGKVWISTIQGGEAVTEAVTADSKAEAAFLVTSNVRAWHELIIDENMNLEGLQECLQREMGERKLSQSDTVPFVVMGTFDELQAHVVNGGCPFAADPALRKEPVREKRTESPGTLIGFMTSLPPGTLTHHGSRLHVHVALDGPVPYAGHLDHVVIGKGSRLLLPVSE